MSRIPLSTTLALLAVAVVSTSLSAGQIEPGFEEYLQTLDAGTHVRAIIKMRDQISIPSLEAGFRYSGATMAERHATVITKLHDITRESQPAILGLLNGARGSGEVREFRSFWISNLVALEAVPAFLFALAEREDIDTIYEDAPIEAIQPVSSGPVGEAARGVEPGVEATGAPILWSMGITGLGTLVSHLDTGVAGTHPALADRWRGLDEGVTPQEAWYDPVTNTTFPFDAGSHGTHTMGTICGKDGDNIIGMAYGAKWISAGVIDRVSISQTLADAIAAFEWAADPDGNPGTMNDVPDCISNSWGLSPLYHGYAACSDAGLWGVIDNVEAAGSVVVFAAGNEGSGSQTLRIPADRDATPVNSFAVGALNQGAETIAGFSSRGPSGCPTASIKPEVCAVGVDVRSSVPSSGYSTMSGTSMACPHVAGAVALLRQVNPEATVEDIKYALYYTAVDLGPAGEDNDYGMGKIDVVAAAEYVGLGSLATLTGTVTAEVGGAPLTARLALSGDLNVEITAAADGSYMLKVPPGEYDLEAWMFGYLPETASLTVGEGETINTDFALALAPMATLEGTITNTDTGLP
ncbi:S8 family serine peptidase, partial [Thermodesulfobacteriota bacterium]